jgi:hypothetical protein
MKSVEDGTASLYVGTLTLGDSFAMKRTRVLIGRHIDKKGRSLRYTKTKRTERNVLFQLAD